MPESRASAKRVRDIIANCGKNVDKSVDGDVDTVDNRAGNVDKKRNYPCHRDTGGGMVNPLGVSR